MLAREDIGYVVVVINRYAANVIHTTIMRWGYPPPCQRIGEQFHNVHFVPHQMCIANWCPSFLLEGNMLLAETGGGGGHYV